jgi:hypothetical protein
MRLRTNASHSTSRTSWNSKDAYARTLVLRLGPTSPTPIGQAR